MKEGDAVQALARRHSEMEAKRSGFTSQFLDLQRYVRPNTSSFTTGGNSVVGETNSKDIYDSTACWAADQFANGMHSSVTSPSDRWFQITIPGIKNSPLPREIQLYLETVNDLIYQQYSRPEANLNPSLHENYLDLGVFGTDCLYQEWNPNNRSLLFRAIGLGEIQIDEGADGFIDTVFRTRAMTARQVLQEFPRAKEIDKLVKERPDREVTVIHSVYPREDWRYGLIGTDKPFASIYWIPEYKAILSEGGFSTFPYHLSRWSKQTGEVFGRGPGMSVLPSIKMLNQMKKELIVSAQLANRPPIVADEDSLLLPVGKKSFSLVPGSVLFKTPGSEMPTPFLSGTQPQLTMELIDNEQQRITQAFYVDYLIRGKKKERQSVLEIQDDRGEMMRQMAPMCGRIETEKLGPMLARSFGLMQAHGMLPSMPAQLRGLQLVVSYISPVAKAQIGAKGSQLSAFLQDLTPWGNVDPSIFSKLDSEEILREFTDARNISPKVIKSPERLAQEAKQQTQQQQTQQITEAAPNLSKSVKDLAQARSMDPSMFGGM